MYSSLLLYICSLSKTWDPEDVHCVWNYSVRILWLLEIRWSLIRYSWLSWVPRSIELSKSLAQRDSTVRIKWFMSRLPGKAREDVNSILRQKSLGNWIGFDYHHLWFTSRQVRNQLRFLGTKQSQWSNETYELYKWQNITVSPLSPTRLVVTIIMSSNDFVLLAALF